MEQWCNTCSNMVNPMREGENKCPVCGSEFTEATMDQSLRLYHNEGSDLIRSASVFSLYAPILLGLMSALRPALATISSNSSSSSNNNGSSSREEEDNEQEMEQHGDLVVRRRRRTSSASLMLVFRRLHDRMSLPESDQNTNTENDHGSNDGGGDNNVNLNVVVIDPFNEEALILRGSSRMNSARSTTPLIENPMGSLGDFLEGPGFGLLLQHLTQNNEPNRYVSNVNPPAQKAAIEAMPTVITEENMQCIICLEDAETGSEVKEMPCGHRFHSDCIFSWLKLRSSCPVCRFQMPSDDSKVESNGGRRNEGDPSNDQVMDREQRMSFGRRNWLSISQPFDYFLPSP
ncbi:E3 ubiquitin-protein ligase SIRP1-like [Prosopis cineraria]|uniref:E3 ubiquitin-protein ligase SIRP1-like n=1 Tax=Prosopis cineraria TaxID=364024 RepID=UPI0024103B52|nr:E3 ubiquitin-protein ligase SIRP1-like [Prosopis cineraria]XP_054784528.1 E3 ubiquitin-protein ligase SIRP1-like [Prosopis cineraria]